MQRYRVAVVDVDAFDDVDFADGVFGEVVGPAEGWRMFALEAIAVRRFMEALRAVTHSDGQMPHATPGICSMSAIMIPGPHVACDSRRTLLRPWMVLLWPRSLAMFVDSTPM